MIFANTRRRVSIEVGVLFDLGAITALVVLCFALSYWPALLRSAIEGLLSPFALDRVQEVRVGMRLSGLLVHSRVSFITAAITLIAMFMSTRGFRWWRWSMIAILPLIYGYGAGYARPPLNWALQQASVTDDWFIGLITSAAINLLFVAFVAWVVSSRLVFAFALLATMLSTGQQLWIIHNMPIVPGTNGGRDSPVWQWVVAPSIQTVIALGLVIWALRARSGNPVKGLCTSCGYDLRGSAHSRCPECGSPVPAVALR